MERLEPRNPTAPVTLLEGPDLAIQVLPVGDWNSDGFDDLAVAVAAFGDVRVYLGSTAGLNQDNFEFFNATNLGTPASSIRLFRSGEPGSIGVYAGFWHQYKDGVDLEWLAMPLPVTDNFSVNWRLHDGDESRTVEAWEASQDFNGDGFHDLLIEHRQGALIRGLSIDYDAMNDFDQDGDIDFEDADFVCRHIHDMENVRQIGVMAGDSNGDDVVDLDDFFALTDSFGQSHAGLSGGDFNCDSRTDFADFLILSRNFA